MWYGATSNFPFKPPVPRFYLSNTGHFAHFQALDERVHGQRVCRKLVLRRAREEGGRWGRGEMTAKRAARIVVAPFHTSNEVGDARTESPCACHRPPLLRTCPSGLFRSEQTLASMRLGAMPTLAMGVVGGKG